MIISQEHRFVFIEVPHTGTHSISAELVEFYGGKPILRKHSNVSEFLAHASKVEKTYFKFATVRNPLDHLVTQYFKYQSNHKGQYTNPAKFIENGGSVTPLHREHFRFVHEQQRPFDAFFLKYFDKTYNNWMLLGSGHLDFVLRYESLQDDYRTLLSRLELPFHRALPHTNATSGKSEVDYRDFYPRGVMDKVLRNYGPFMERWGYDLPAGYSYADVPASSRLRFRALEVIVDRLAGVIELNPNRPALARTKQLVDRFM